MSSDEQPSEVNTNYQAVSQHTRLIKTSSWNKHHEWPPIGGLRYLIFQSKTNGFDKVIKRVGRSVLIDEAAFFDWVSEQNDQKAKKE